MKSPKCISILLFLFSINVTANSNIKTWHYDVYLDDDRIGEHTFLVNKQKEKSIVEINADFNVKFLFITAYEYKHSNTEIWQSQCLTDINSSTDDNGTRYQIQGKKIKDTLKLTVNQQNKEIKGCIHTFSYWDSNILKQNKLLNSQTGEYEDVVIKNAGEKTISILNKSYLANHYILNSKKFSIDLWYSKEGEWLSLRSTTDDGNVLTYQLKGEIQ